MVSRRNADDYRPWTHTESGIKISKTFNPIRQSIERSVGGKRVPSVGYSQDDLIIAMTLSQTPSVFPCGFSRSCCFRMSLKMATMFQFHRHLRMIDFGSVEGSAISCWGDVVGWLVGDGTRPEAGTKLRMERTERRERRTRQVGVFCQMLLRWRRNEIRWRWWDQKLLAFALKSQEL